MIELRRVSKSFGKRKIFENITRTFEAGKVYALIGTSGSGKTTLLNIIAGLEDCQGEVYFEGKSLKKISRQKFLSKNLSYLFQNFALMENATIEENLKLAFISEKIKTREKHEKMLGALEKTGISYLDLKQKIYELSGGEAQRVALAKAILKNAPILLADEPTAALDQKNGDEIMRLLLKMRNSECVIILATHNPDIWSMADEVIRIGE